MATQITLNEFNALTLAEKFEMFGQDLFTTKQFNLINAIIDSDCYGVKFLKVCDLLQVSKASLSSVIGSLKSLGVVYIHKTFGLNCYKNCRLSKSKLDSILYTHFIDLLCSSYIENSAQETAQDIEEAPAQETAQDTQDTPVNFSEIQKSYLEEGKTFLRKVKHLSLSYDEEKTQNELVRNLAVSINKYICKYEKTDEILIQLSEWVEKTLQKRADLEEEKEQLKKSPKRLKPNTIKNYTAHQLAKHLDRLQDVFWESEVYAPYWVDFSYSEIRKYDDEDKCYYFECNLIHKEGVIDCINQTYKELGI